jgi:phosphohistidine phosphatase
MVEWLRRQTDPATWIWTSSAVRARATTIFLQTAFELPDEGVAASLALYHASPDALLDVIQQTPDNIQSLAVVAHNPGMTWLVNSLCGAEVTVNLPTFGVARLDCPQPWHELRVGRATLDLLDAPKTID